MGFNFWWLLIGFVSGNALCIIIWIVRKAKIYDIFSNKNKAENIGGIFCISVVILTVLSDFGLDLNGSLCVAVFTIIGSMGFSYLVTRKFSRRDYENRLKEEASTAYRHNKSLLLKIDYEIKLIDVIFSQNTCSKNQESCEHMQVLYRLRDSLIHFKRDAEENINDWSNIIADEIATVNEIVECEERKAKLLFELTDTEDELNIEHDKEKEELQEISDKIEKFKKKLEDKPIYKIILKNEVDYAQEMDNLIQVEKNAKNSMQIKTNQNLGLLKHYINELEKLKDA